MEYWHWQEWGMKIRNLMNEPKDQDIYELKRLFSSLDEETAENYGRFNTNDLRFGAETIVERIIGDKNEIGLIGMDDEHYYLGPPIGYAHIYLSEKESRRHSAGFGIVIHQDYQGQGYGEQLIKEAIKTAKRWKVKKIWLHVYSFNKPAIGLYRKMGFKREGVFRKEEYKKGRFVDVISMAKWI